MSDSEKMSHPDAAAENPSKGDSPRKKESVRELGNAIIVALILALFIRTFAVQAFKIPSGSMIPTLLVGDYILVNKFVYGIPIPFTDQKLIEFKTPTRGEVVVFRFPRDPSKDFIKRVIGIPGDKVELRDGRLHLNGEPVAMREQGDYVYAEARDEFVTMALYQEYIDDSQHPIILSKETIPTPARNHGPIYVPEGKLFTLGDNRDGSNDSRYWGFVDIDQVKGRSIFIYWSWDSIDGKPRWERLGSLVR
jgi:signal peptidase I